LDQTDGKKNELLVPLEFWRENGQSGKEQKPDREPGCVETVKPPGFRIENGRSR
jgi:hypothetical protein